MLFHLVDPPQTLVPPDPPYYPKGVACNKSVCDPRGACKSVAGGPYDVAVAVMADIFVPRPIRFESLLLSIPGTPLSPFCGPMEGRSRSFYP